MACKALNTVHPLYRVSMLGMLYTSHAMEVKAYAASVRDAVTKAIETVRKNPSHDPQPAEEEPEA
jgi:competence protein ComFB